MRIQEAKTKLEELFSAVAEETTKLEFNPKDKKGVYAAANHCTCLDSSNSILKLIEVKGSATTIPQIVRGMLEAYANQLNIINHEGYVESLAIDFLHMQKVLTKKCMEAEGAGDDANPFLKEALEDDSNWAQRLEQLEETIGQCKEMGGQANSGVGKV